jgi:hypothetical protein
MDEDGRGPARPNPWKRPAARPEIRPVAVWVITGALVVVGLLFLYAGVTTFADAIDHGDEDARFPSLMAATVGVLTILFAGGLFFGARWGRHGAVGVCVLICIGVIAGLARETIGWGAAMIGFVVGICLFFALLGPKAHDWTGGDDPS